MTRIRGVMTVLVACVLVASPFVALYLLLGRLREVPEEIQPIVSPQLVKVTRSDEYDEQPVIVRVKTDPGPFLRAPDWTGLVQAVTVELGDEIRSGEPIVTIDGVARLALNSPFPFSRALQRGDKGPEVAQLQRALGILGYAVDVDGNFGASTESAVEDLQATLGVQDPSGAFTPDLVVWLPIDSLEVNRVALDVGDPAPAQGTVIFESPDVATLGWLVPLDGGQFDDRLGEYDLIIGENFALGSLDEAGLTTDQLNRLMKWYRDGLVTTVGNGEGAQNSASQKSELTLDFAGTVKLRSPAIRSALPVSSVVGSPKDSSAQCVFIATNSGFTPFETTVVTGGFGWVAVEPAPSAATMVLANPVEVLDDPSCG